MEKKKPRYSLFIARNAGVIATVGTLLALIGGYFSVLLYKNLRTDIEELLPTAARSGRDLKVLTSRVESFDYVAILVFSQDAKGSQNYVDALAERLRQIPKDLAARVEYRISGEREFFHSRAGLYLDLSDLVRIRDYVHERIRYEQEMYNPLNIFPVSDRLKKPELDFNQLFSKYQGSGAYDKFPQGYYATPDGKIRTLLVYLQGKHSDIHKAQRLKAGIDRAIAEVDPKKYAPDIRIGFSGGVEGFLEEHAALIQDLELSTAVVILLVTLAMVLFYRDVFATGALIASLFAGTLWTFGISYFVVGYLNANSAFLGSIVIGNGINFGVILLARYVEERRKRLWPVRAADTAMRGTLSATLTAALAAGLSYGSLMLTRFRGFQQFGTIGFIGMVLCWISAFTLLPAYLELVERFRARKPRVPKGSNWLDRLAEGIASAIERWAAPIFAVSIGLTVGALALVPRLGPQLIETDLNKLRNKGTIEHGAGYYDEFLKAIFQHYLTSTVVLADNREDAIAIAAKLKALQKAEGSASLIASVQTLSDFVPPDQAKKIAVLRDIKKEFSPRIVENLEEKEASWIRDFLSEGAFSPIEERDLPPLVLEKFRERNGDLGKLVVIEPPYRKDDDIAWKGEELIRFITQVRAAADAVKPGTPVAGQLPISADMVESIMQDGPKATLFAFLSVVLLVAVLFRQWRTTALALFALVQGVIWLGGLILGFQLKINFLNFIALPITFGIGIDYGVNIFQRFRTDTADRRGRESILRAVRQTGGAVMLASLTTMIGYSSLLIAGNQAFVSFGTLAVLGEIACVLAAVVSLPAWLYLREQAKSGKKVSVFQELAHDPG